VPPLLHHLRLRSKAAETLIMVDIRRARTRCCRHSVDQASPSNQAKVNGPFSVHKFANLLAKNRAMRGSTARTGENDDNEMTCRPGGVAGMVVAEEERKAAQARWDPSRQRLEGRARGRKNDEREFYMDPHSWENIY
jgi:hypothetical protein